MELLTGSPPYYNLNSVTAMLKIAHEGLPPLPEEISPELKDFLGHCFAKDPVKRKTAGELLTHPWIVQMGSETEVKTPVSGAESKVGVGTGIVAVEFSESEQDKTMVPIGRPEVLIRGQKNSSKDHPHTHPVFFYFNNSKIRVIVILKMITKLLCLQIIQKALQNPTSHQALNLHGHVVHQRNRH